MTSIVQIAAGVTNAKLVDPSDDVKTIVQELLSYTVEGAQYMSLGASWSGKSSFFSYTSCKFPAGFVFLVKKQLESHGFKVRLIQKKAIEPLGPANPIVDEFGNDDPRYDYQPKALRKVEKHGRGIIRVATGGGKSKIAKLIAARYRRLTLFITTRGVLMHQMADAMKDSGMPVGIVGDGIWQPIKGMNCCMVQTLVSKLEEPDFNAEMRTQRAANGKRAKEEKLTVEQMTKLASEKMKEKERERARTIKFLELAEVVIGEEAHEAGGNSYYQILKHCKNARIRVALTATPFMKDNVEDNMRLMAAFGPILIDVSEKMLIDRGILATPIFKFQDSKPHDKLRKHSPWQRAYQLGYVENDYMLRDAIRDALMAKEYGLPTITLIQRTAHGQRVQDAYKKAGLDFEYLKGEDKQAERKRQLARLERGEIDGIIGTTIIDVGVDVPAVGLVQLLGGGKAEVALRQRIGRGLRAKKAMPNYCFIIDYHTGPNKTLNQHTATRRNIIRQTEGFAENILPEGADLPWKIFEENTRAA
ncbi:MAG: DEAD/DEAH box helicase family protein [Roseibium sp.]|nr:DEAD/DEAH box helicase family protein [Roseibium sp.]